MLGKRIKYPTMNSWNNEYGIAYNMKIYNVIKKELRDKAYKIYDDDNLARQVYSDIEFLIKEFKENTGWDAGFNGRSGGYLVLYNTRWDYENNKSITIVKGYEEKDVPTDVKKEFRKLAQDIIKTVEWYCTQEIEEYEETHITKHLRFKE